MSADYSIGIDLGTTNSVLAYLRLDSKDSMKPTLLPIPQITAVNQTESLPSLASFLYIANETESQSDGLSVFNDPLLQDRCTGEFARRNSALQPHRTVVAAKSWLCNRSVDRRAEILPWQSPTDEVKPVSPIDTSAAYLRHLALAWNQAFPDFPIDQQLVTLTVPASFDLSARELTIEAAKLAGLPEDLILLEEPQAAVYQWIQSTGDSWRRMVARDETILVCDVGGGTTDLTLLTVDEIDGDLNLRRIAVGNHLLVGGDNMDLALAHHASTQFAKRNVKLNPWQSISLWHSCRNAKEVLLSQENIPSHSITLLGRGSKLIGGTVSIDLSRDEVQQILVDGFFPECDFDSRPDQSIQSGFQEIGLPYEMDTGITRHVAAFINDHLASEHGEVRFPSHVLFNGGVFRAEPLRERMLSVLSDWSKNDEANKATSIAELGGVRELDSAVAMGAAYYGWSKKNGGVRIRGGTAQSYYVGIESAGLAVPGMPRPMQALCVVNKGMEEGTQADVPSNEFGLVVGKPVSFRFFASGIRPDDKLGTKLRHWDDEELVETDPLEMTLAENSSTSDPSVSSPSSSMFPVRFHSKITELGMFELWCNSTRDSNSWKLEFNVRPKE